jgi:monofunctional biosynthetic peptidoglycan transglycosylase
MPAGPSPLLRSLGRALLAVAALLLAAAAGSALLWHALPDPAPLARQNPRTTALIEQRRAEARARRQPFRPWQVWTPLERISPRMVDAVILSEDATFYGHQGFDWEALKEAARRDLSTRRFSVGGSTLSQQLAKNLWLGTEKSLLRKGKEAILTAKLERALAKRRILALYLNVVEFGDGVFGVEAGARSRFQVGAAGLSTAQAVVLASLLPAPRKISLAKPSTWLKARARILLDRLRIAGRITTAEHLHASAELERILAGPAPADDRDDPPEEDPPTAKVPTVEPVAAPPTEAAGAAPPAAPGAAPAEVEVEASAGPGDPVPDPAPARDGPPATSAAPAAPPDAAPGGATGEKAAP